MTEDPQRETNAPDVALVGAGIMSATLAVMLKELDPTMNIELYEVLGSPPGRCARSSAVTG